MLSLLILFLILVWIFSVTIIYKNSELENLSQKGIHFEFAAIVMMGLVFINEVISGETFGVGLIVVLPIVLSRFFTASAIIQRNKKNYE
jgi:hypothetical protein